MKKKLALALAAAMIMSLALAGCGGNDKPAASSGNASAGGSASASASQPASDGLAPKDGGTSLTFTTGGETGTYYGFGNVIANKVGDLTSTSVKAISSGGSAANIQALEDGDAQLGFVQSDVMVYAFNGERTFAETGACTGFSTVANLYMEQVQIVTVDPSIKTVADLAGKKVSVGAAGSGVYFNAVDVLGVYGLDVEKDIVPTYQSFGDSAEALKDGQIDAAFIVAGAPTTAVTDLASGREISLVSLDQEHIDKLIESSPYYSPNTIAKDVYGTAEDATTVAVGAVVIARDDVSEADVYNFLYGTFEDIPNLSHGKAAELDLDFAASVTAIGYHPGAVAYFADKGITVPAK
ncbi:TAXI family TRAP transporter solute-binding subunit [Pseudoflavonifractor phocaeensis]|uniref:TAXI family TRAP transporter solute-binding subunit n=1 Tax=Pseudoflavonifractor phocaeensis TaxID=1870988 RepID=UPI001F1D1523|nr:TAXI family TRAP transporter solute-binding subunit [Pseudoflavonifractor phocaeensis]MCF2595309.1 TAXI family TRAP transporter solute-binding subunit [Pseudoflavonifractor phocaeensis]MDY3906760.1 TAXI family TRAP transporter solute-binding subunit [Lawsonibacter sp.]